MHNILYVRAENTRSEVPRNFLVWDPNVGDLSPYTDSTNESSATTLNVMSETKAVLGHY